MVNEESLRSDLQQMIFETTGVRPLIDYRDDPLVDQMMKGCSKAGTKNRGIPDLVFRLKDVLVIIEVKHRINKQTSNAGYSPFQCQIPFGLDSTACKSFAEDGALSYIYRGCSNVDWKKNGISAVFSLGVSMESKSHFVGRGFIYNVALDAMARMHPFHSPDYFEYNNLRKESGFLEKLYSLDDDVLDEMCQSFKTYCSKRLKLNIDDYLPELSMIMMAKGHATFNVGEMMNDNDSEYILKLCKKSLSDYHLDRDKYLGFVIDLVMKGVEEYTFPKLPIRQISDYLDTSLGLTEIFYGIFIRGLIGTQYAYNRAVSELVRREPRKLLYDVSSQFALAAFYVGRHGCNVVPHSNRNDPSTDWIVSVGSSMRQTLGNAALLVISRFDVIDCVDAELFKEMKNRKATIVVADWSNDRIFDMDWFMMSMNLLMKDCLGVFIFNPDVVYSPSLSPARDKISRKYTVEKVVKCKGAFIVSIRKSPNADLTKTTKMIDLSRRKVENLPIVVRDLHESDYYRRKLKDGRWYIPR